MGGYTVVSISRTTGRQRYLDSLGVIAGLTFDHSWPGGCLSAQWQLTCPPDSGDPALNPGRLIEIWGGGGVVWSGVLGESDPGIPRTMHASGHQTELGGYPAATFSNTGGVLTPTGSVDLQAVFDSAVTNLGLSPVHRGTFPAVSSSITEQPTSIADLANAYTQVSGQRWKIDPYRYMSFAADPTTADYMYVLNDPLGRQSDGYASDVWVKYNETSVVGSTTVTTQKWVALSANPTASAYRPFGFVGQIIDITDQPAMTSSQAAALFAQARTLLGSRLTFTGNVTCTAGQMLSRGGVPVDLGTVHAGKAVLMVGAMANNAQGEENWTGGVVVPIGQSSYDVDTNTLTWQPVNTLRQDFLGFLEHTASYQ